MHRVIDRLKSLISYEKVLLVNSRPKIDEAYVYPFKNLLEARVAGSRVNKSAWTRVVAVVVQ